MLTSSIILLLADYTTYRQQNNINRQSQRDDKQRTKKRFRPINQDNVSKKVIIFIFFFENFILIDTEKFSNYAVRILQTHIYIS